MLCKHHTTCCVSLQKPMPCSVPPPPTPTPPWTEFGNVEIQVHLDCGKCRERNSCMLEFFKERAAFLWGVR